MDLTIRILDKATRIEVNQATYVSAAEFDQLRRQFLHATLQHEKTRERNKTEIRALRKSLERCLKEAEAAIAGEPTGSCDGWASTACDLLTATKGD